MLLKALLLVCGILAVQSQEIRSPILKKTLHSAYFNRVSDTSESSTRSTQNVSIILLDKLDFSKFKFQ